jgi:hypothetical protein
MDTISLTGSITQLSAKANQNNEYRFDLGFEPDKVNGSCGCIASRVNGSLVDVIFRAKNPGTSRKKLYAYKNGEKETYELVFDIT